MSSIHLILITLYLGLFIYLRWKTHLAFRVTGWPSPDQGAWKWELARSLVRGVAVISILVLVLPKAWILADWMFRALALLFPLADAFQELDRESQRRLVYGSVGVTLVAFAACVASDIRRLIAGNWDPGEESQTRKAVLGVFNGIIAVVLVSSPLWSIWLWSAIRPLLFEPQPPFLGPVFRAVP